jgi:hypothetical protein
MIDLAVHNRPSAERGVAKFCGKVRFPLIHHHPVEAAEVFCSRSLSSQFAVGGNTAKARLVVLAGLASIMFVALAIGGGSSRFPSAFF